MKPIFTEEHIKLDVSCADKSQTIDILAGLAMQDRCFLQREELLQKIWEREGMGYTGLGNAIAMAHVESPFVQENHMYCVRLIHEVDWGPGTDYKRKYRMIRLAFLFVVPQREEKDVSFLKKIVFRLWEKERVHTLLETQEKSTVIATLLDE